MWGYLRLFCLQKSDSTGNNPDFIVIWGCKQLFLCCMRRALLGGGWQAHSALYYSFWKKGRRWRNDNKKWQRKVVFCIFLTGIWRLFLSLAKNIDFLTNNEFQCKKMHSASISKNRITFCANFNNKTTRNGYKRGPFIKKLSVLTWTVRPLKKQPPSIVVQY